MYIKNLIVLISIFSFFSCNDKVLLDEKNNIIEKRNSVNISNIAILKLNEQNSVEISGILTGNITYRRIAPSITDKFGVIEVLSNNNVINNVIVFNSSYSGSVGENIVSFEGRGNGGGVDYSCECNQGTYDCVVRKHSNLRECDGNFCTACSIIVSGKTINGAEFVGKSGIIFLNN